MKITLVLAALLSAVTACATTEQAAGNANLAAANANRAAPQPTPAAVSEAELVAADRQIWEAVRTENWDAFAALLADESLSVSGAGLRDKAQSIEDVRTFDLIEYSVSDTRVLRLGPDAAVLTYASKSGGRWTSNLRLEVGRPLDF